MLCLKFGNVKDILIDDKNLKYERHEGIKLKGKEEDVDIWSVQLTINDQGGSNETFRKNIVCYNCAFSDTVFDH
jgi:hypothetical protein